jgi:ubiquinone/menaquinone biosynthesis C-methylase UbiE
MHSQRVEPADTYQAAFAGEADPREQRRLDLQFAMYARLASWTLDALALAPGQAVLEIGCGGGALLTVAAERVGPLGRVVGIDRDPAVLAQARRRTAGYPWVEIVAGDAKDLGAGERFDAVHCRLVLMHQFDPDGFVARMVALARPGGRVAAQEYDTGAATSWPPLAALDAIMAVAVPAYQATGMDNRAGGRLLDRFHRAGLASLRAECETPYFALTDARAALLFAQFERLGASVEGLGLLSEADYDACLADLRRLHRDPAFGGHLVRYLTMAAAVGTKPTGAQL